MKLTIVCECAEWKILLKFNKKNHFCSMETVKEAVELFLPI